MEREIWRPVVGYEGLYEVSNYGNVKSIPRNGTVLKEKILKKAIKRGYYAVCVSKDNKQKYLLVHRLVAQAFIPNPYKLPQVNHKDENKLNNSVDNLEWCDAKYNMTYNDIHIKKGFEHRNNSQSIPIVQYTIDGEFVAEYPSISEAKRKLGFKGLKEISYCCQHRKHYNTYKGFRWEYKEREAS